MVRYTITGLAAGAFLGSMLLAGVAGGQKPAPKADPQLFTFTTLEVPESDGQLQRLLKQRYNAAGEELEALTALYRGGRVNLDNVCASIERFTKASLELSENPVERVAKLDRALIVARNIEEIVNEKFSFDVEPVQAVKHDRYVRLDLEIQLLRVREAAKLGAAGGPAADVVKR